MKERKLVPKRRFRDFTKEWERNKLKDLADFSKGNGYSKMDLVPSGKPIILYGQLYTNYQVYIRDFKTFVLKQDNSIISKGNEVIIPSSGETNKDIARAAVVSKPGVILGSDLNIINPRQSLSSLFLALSISSGNQQKELSKRAQGKSVVHLYNSDIEKISISYPSLEEQQKIGKFFKHLDQMISLEQHKLEKTKALKSAYLAEMFPVEGERVPKRRFVGYVDNWKRYTLEDVAEVKTGKAFSSIYFHDKGEYLVVTNKDISSQDNKSKIVGNRINISDENILSRYLLSDSNILITMDGNVGRVGKYTNAKAVLAQRVARLNSDQFEFVYQIINRNNFLFEMNKVSVGNIIKHISLKQIAEYSFLAPKDKNEQQAIGMFFKKLDDKITNQQQKLDKLKAMKQAYLEEMFV